MAGLLIASLPFFVYIAHKRRQAAAMLLAFSSEKDGLIAELCKAGLDQPGLLSDDAPGRTPGQWIEPQLMPISIPSRLWSAGW